MENGNKKYEFSITSGTTDRIASGVQSMERTKLRHTTPPSSTLQKTSKHNIDIMRHTHLRTICCPKRTVQSIHGCVFFHSPHSICGSDVNVPHNNFIYTMLIIMFCVRVYFQSIK